MDENAELDPSLARYLCAIKLVRLVGQKRLREYPRIRQKTYDLCAWQRWLNARQDQLQDKQSRAYKQFRNKWRVPYDMMPQLLEMCRDMGLEKQEKDCCGYPSLPLHLKLMGVLRVLGRGVDFDEVGEHTDTDGT
jgi:hypothetical protein